MAELRYEITGTASGLGNAANTAKGILAGLQQAANGLKIDILGATSKEQIDAIGGALTVVTGKIKEYTTSAIQGSQAFKDQQSQAALDTLATKITVLTGKSQLFGDTVSNQQAQVRAYTSAIESLLKNGVDPLDSRIQTLKGNIDNLTRSIEAQKQAAKTFVDPFAQFKTTGSLILDSENKVNRLQESLRRATSTRDIAQYNIRLQEANAQLTALRGTGLRAAEAQTQLGNAARRVGGGFNSVGVELGRVIQDAPYAANNFGAIGNNITRLVEVIPGYLAQTRAVIIANGGVATSANVARAAVAGLFTGFGAVLLAISALVSVYTVVSMRQKKNTDELEENAEAAKKTTESFGKLKAQIQSVSDSRLDGILGGASDLAKLQQLYSASQDLNIPLKDRKRIVDELQEQYPTTFSNFSDEAILAGKASSAYERLNAALINKAIIQANTENLAAAIKPLLRMQEVAAQTEKQIKAAQAVLANPLAGFEVRQKAQDDLKRLQLGDTLFGDFNKKAKQSLKDTIQGILDAGNDLIKEFGAGIIVDDGKGGGSKYLSTVSEKLNEILRKTQEIAGQSGLDSYALQVQKVIDKYKNLNTELDKTLEKNRSEFNSGKIDQKTFTANQQAGITDRQALANAQYIELINGEIKERQRVVDEIQRINDAFGVKSEQDRQKELAQIKAFYDKEVRLAKGNKDIIAALDSGRTAAESATNKKFDDKAAQPIVDFFDKIRKKQEKDAEKQEDHLANVLSRSLRSFGQSFIDTLTSVETYSKGTFTSIFADLTANLTSSLNKVFLDVVLDGLSKSLTSAIAKGTSALISPQGKLTGLGAGIAGAGVLGGILSASTPQTSIAGQGAGGLLSGAAAGAAIGSVVPVLGTIAGGVIGGLVGAIGGIFGASSARKRQEELQKQQLEEAKKQTELLRQAQAAYTSQIIGRMTANGTVTGINVGATGQLTAVVSGKDLQFILDRTKNGR